MSGPVDDARLAELQRLSDELLAENIELSRAHSLMAAQFRTMQAEKDAGWDESERQESRAEALTAELSRLRAEHNQAEVTIEYGYLTVEVGWVPERRGEHYALHQREVRRGPVTWIADGSPVAALVPVQHPTESGQRP